ncbi:MAG TPA: amylo-alpha-1,6-glucosidase [Blastocatellia bacterium]|nr:amylo-alpha-1,6-glucosidase [Blastocatellia bacterium]
MDNIVRAIRYGAGDDKESLLTREWLVTNGLGGYASGTISGIPTRRFHGLLIAALAAPFGRVMMLNDLREQVVFAGGERFRLGGEERADGTLELYAAHHLKEFRLEMGLPVWLYEVNGVVLEKRVLIPRLQNTVHINYRLVSGDLPVQIELRPFIHFRPHEGSLSAPVGEPYTLSITEDLYEISEGSGSQLPPLRMMIDRQAARFTVDGRLATGLLYRIEQRRGYDCAGDLWSPGYFHMALGPGEDLTLMASTENWDTLHALRPEEARLSEYERRKQIVAAAHPEAQSGPAAELVLAADEFIATPSGRTEEAARAHAIGDEVRTVIAGYHWFTDWGRDTMISLEGLTLVTGRHAEAGFILRTFAHYIRDGLIPNLFPEGEKEGLYHTADATLWFFHALDRYVEATGDRSTLEGILPRLIEVIDHHLRGTRFGIGVDPADGLLRQGAEGYQLTWMDAKVEGWVVTPRRGKAVEINALWYNALRLMEGWLAEAGKSHESKSMSAHAERARESFNRRFWFGEGGYLYDVIDGESGDDAAIRPNQLLAISLRHPVLDRDRWKQVLDIARERLLTPVGLRSLAPGHPDYKPQYYGDLRSRDAAYHQGTVWGWLIGPFVDAWLKAHPEDRREARRFLDGFVPHLDEACVGSISEIFDAEPPFTPRGCIAQAWSVAEALRVWVKIRSQKPEARR